MISQKHLGVERKCIFVLGMHRSGTSALAGSLKSLGLDLGDNLMPANAYNEKGYFEDLDIYRLNDRILSAYGRTWDSLYPFAIVKNDFLKKEIQTIYLQKFGNSNVSVIKDPRISLLFPIWQEALQELNIRCYAAIMVRNPIEVADSLKRRDRFSLIKSLLLWASHTLYAEQNTRNVHGRIFIPHENFLKDPGRYIRRLTTLISPSIKLTGNAIKEIHNFIDPSLRHHQSSKMEMPEGFHWVLDLCKALFKKQIDLHAFDEGLTKLKSTVKLYYPEDISRTLSADLNFPKSTLYIDTGAGFEGQQKVHIPFNCTMNNFSISFNALGKFRGIRAVRWDPTESDFIKLKIDSIVAVDLEGKPVEIKNHELKSNGTTTLDKPVEFHTTDPWVEIPLSLPIEEIKISGRIWLLDTRNGFQNLNNQISQAKKEIQTADSVKKQLTQEKNEWFNETKAQLTEIRKLLIEKGDLLKQLSEAGIRLANVSAETEKFITELKQIKFEKENLTTQLKQGNSEKENLTTQLKQSNSEKENLTTQLKQSNSENENLTTQLKQSNSEKESLTTQLKQSNSEKESLTTQLKQSNSEKETLIAELNQLKSEFSVEKKALLKQHDEEGLKIADLLKEKADLISRVDEQKTEITKLHQEKDRLATQFNGGQSWVKQLEKELTTNKTIIKTLEDRIQSETKTYNEKVRALEADVAAKSKDLTFYKALTDDLPASAHSRSMKRILYRLDRIFNYETRVPESDLLNQLVFDSAYYQEANPQLKDIIKNDPKLAVKHWLEKGVYQGLAASPCFYVSFYLQKNKDLKKHFKKNYQGAIKHWIESGIKEMRACSPEFSLQSYLSRNPKIATTYANDFKGALLYWLHNEYKPGDRSSIEGQVTTMGSPKGEGKKNEGLDDHKNSSHNGSKQTVLINESRELLEKNIWPTKRKKMDGKRLQSQAVNREHFWYQNHEIDNVLNDAHKLTKLPKGLRRLLVIAHDFRLTTGVSRSISHYLNAMVALGGREFTSIEIAPNAIASVAKNHIDTHDFVIINSIAPLFYYDGMIDLLGNCRNKVAIYLHETQWVFDKLSLEQPVRFEQFVKALPEFNILCVSRAQQAWLQEKYGVQRSFLVHEVTVLAKLPANDSFSDLCDTQRQIHIVMAGTIQPRKGPTLFSKVADMAHSSGLPWIFSWAGLQVSKDESVYKSSNVNWVGNLDDSSMSDFLHSADIFFLSSEDDPFPLCILEALKAKKRVVVYKKTGASELFFGHENSAGVIFEDYTPEAAFEALHKAASIKCTTEHFERLNNAFSLSSFILRLHGAISEIYES